MKGIKINGFKTEKGDMSPPYLIAEAGVNHEGDIDKAKQMIEEVAKAGGNAIKFQAYKAETLASIHSPAYWDTTKEKTASQFELFKKHDAFWKEEFEELGEYARRLKVDFLATPFDNDSVDFLEPLAPCYKIASADITNEPFLRYISKKGKPILLSTGASTISEIWRAVEWLTDEGNDKICLLHCTLNYPTDYGDANLGMIRHMENIFPDYAIGYSDHTLPRYMDDIFITSWFLGARVIEKHYTWDKQLPGNDHYHAMDYADLKNIVAKMAFIQKIIGSYVKHCPDNEENSRKFARRSLTAVKHIIKGKTIEEQDITCKRPGVGIPPWMYRYVVGGVALKDIEEDETLMFDTVKLNNEHFSEK